MAKRALLAVCVMSVVGCGEAADEEGLVERTASAQSAAFDGKLLFKHERFGTNDRTCETCHRLAKPGTLNAAQIQALFAESPNDPLFRIVDADDANNDGVIDGDLDGDGLADAGEPITYNRLRTHATNRVIKALPAGVRIAERPSSRSVVLNRGIPAITNTPALDALAMYDGRFGKMTCTPNAFDPNIPTAQTGQKCVSADDFDGDGDFDREDRRGKLVQQAVGAINAHFAPAAEPAPEADATLKAKLVAIADFQSGEFAGAKKGALSWLGALFTPSEALNNIPNGTILPAAPPNDADAVAGRRFFLAPGEDPSLARPAFCGGCHTGAMLDTVPGPVPTALERGNRFATIFSSFFNSLVSERTPDKWPVAFPPLNPVQTFEFDENGDGVFEASVVTADPGLALVTGKAADANRFRILSLWNVKNTAPYFHDSSARTLEEVVEHYDQFFNTISGGFFNAGGVVDMTDEEKRQIVAYLKRL